MEYVDEYRYYDDDGTKRSCTTSCPNFAEDGIQTVDGEYRPSAKTIYLFRAAVESAPFHTYQQELVMDGLTGVSYTHVPLTAYESAVWVIGHEAAHTRGVDLIPGRAHHPNAEAAGYDAVMRYRGLGGQ
jgi:hypothetical protein